MIWLLNLQYLEFGKSSNGLIGGNEKGPTKKENKQGGPAAKHVGPFFRSQSRPIKTLSLFIWCDLILMASC